MSVLEIKTENVADHLAAVKHEIDSIIEDCIRTLEGGVLCDVVISELAKATVATRTAEKMLREGRV